VQGRAWCEEIPQASSVSLTFPLSPKQCTQGQVALVPLQGSEQGYCASVERGAGSGVFESGEQELLSEFDKYRNSTKNRNLDGNFLPNTLFLVKIGTYYRGCRRLFNPL
jgi:hypothetical protein